MVREPPSMGRRALSQSLLLLALASGCEGLKSFKQGLQDDRATLRVEVQPAAGVTVLLDGAELGGASPLVREGLAPGAHRLEVRAPGYHAFSTPVTLRAGQRLTVPLALRPLAAPTDAPPAPPR
jgi:hypothetical protein